MTVEAILYREARLLDEHRFPEWLALFAPDAIYWVPAGGDAPDPAKHVSLIYDDRQRMELRVDRVTGGRAFAQDPLSATVRAVTNIEITEHADGTVEAHSVLSIAELRNSRQRHYMARCRHVLRRTGDAGNWRIVRKEVRLLDRGEVLDNLTLIL